MTRTPEEIRRIHNDFDLASAGGQMKAVVRLCAEYSEVVHEALSVDRPHIAWEKLHAVCPRLRPYIDEAMTLVRRANEGR